MDASSTSSITEFAIVLAGFSGISIASTDRNRHELRYTTGPARLSARAG
jgi:hypothetical protein